MSSWVGTLTETYLYTQYLACIERMRISLLRPEPCEDKRYQKQKKGFRTIPLQRRGCTASCARPCSLCRLADKQKVFIPSTWYILPVLCMYS